MTFKSLKSYKKSDDSSIVEKIYTKLLAFGVHDLSEVNQIIEKYNSMNLESKKNESNIIDLLVYEHLSQKHVPLENFQVKHILSLASSNELVNNSDSAQLLNQLDKIFPQKTKISSMTPNPIHFGPLEGLLSDSFSNIDIKTLLFTIGFWMIVYGLIFYYLYL